MYDPAAETQKALVGAMAAAGNVLQAAIEVAPVVIPRLVRLYDRKARRLMRGERCCGICGQMAYLDAGDFGVCSNCWKREGVSLPRAAASFSS